MPESDDDFQPINDLLFCEDSPRRKAGGGLKREILPDLWLRAAGQLQREHLLAQPREALPLAQARPCWQYNPWLRVRGNRSGRNKFEELPTSPPRVASSHAYRR